MAATPAQNRRYQAALRRVTARLKAEQPETYRLWLDEALTAIDDAGLTKPELRATGARIAGRPEELKGVKPARRTSEVESTVRDLLGELGRSLDEAKAAAVDAAKVRSSLKANRKWTGYTWVDE